MKLPVRTLLKMKLLVRALMITIPNDKFTGKNINDLDPDKMKLLVKKINDHDPYKMKLLVRTLMITNPDIRLDSNLTRRPFIIYLHIYIMTQPVLSRCRRNMAEILLIRRKTLSNQSINIIKVNVHAK